MKTQNGNTTTFDQAYDGLEWIDGYAWGCYTTPDGELARRYLGRVPVSILRDLAEVKGLRLQVTCTDENAQN